ncbi:MAG: TIGR02186 family protein, partial [Pseudomonadota bacterium]|nr:TIGR02186 family protein [Pseudomonadota bacterium]
MTVFPASAAPLVADLSNYSINIDSNFTGTRLFLFGARNDNGDIVVVIRGPARDYIVRRKEEVAGLWVNRGRMKFLNVPDFYAIAASKPLPPAAQFALGRQLGIGQESLLSAPIDPRLQPQYAEFADAFLRHQYGRRLYMRDAGSVQFMAETLFKTVVEFPDDIPPGDYTAEIYLISDGELAGMQSMPIRVVKSGLDEFLYRSAHDTPALYGLAAVALALLIGWAAGRIFEKI